MSGAADIPAQVAALYRQESRRVLATLIRLLGDFDRAEEAMQDAFRAALEQWPREGVPEQARAWLVSTGRFKAIDALRRQARHAPLDDHLDVVEALAAPPVPEPEESGLEDDRLRLVFTCCHPALAPDAQVALTLREVCGLTTEAVASAFLVSATTVAQRIVRAKAKIRDARIPYQVPGPDAWPDRLASVLRVVYLIFNAGYSEPAAAASASLAQEALRLARLLVQLMPDEAEVRGLLALMLLQESRRAARVAPDGLPVLLEQQDRRQWNHDLIAEGLALVVQPVLPGAEPGLYALQAAIAAVHARAAEAAATDWPRIVQLYELLMQQDESPVVALNRAVAVAMRDGAEAGLAQIDTLLARGELDGYRWLHSARAGLLRRAGRRQEALAAYARALELTPPGADREFLLAELRALQ